MFIPNETPISANTISKLVAFIKRHQHNAEGYFLINKEEHFEIFCKEYLYLEAVNGGSVATVSIMKLLRKTFETHIAHNSVKSLAETFAFELAQKGDLKALENLYAAAFNLAHGE